MFDLLVRENALYRDAATLEVGPGNGLVTRRLIEIVVSPLTMIEPDKRFAPFLDALTDEAGDGSQVIYKALEDVELPRSSFNLVVIATTFHWLNPQTRAKTLANLTKPGGFVILMWNVFQDLNLPDAFHEATKDMLADLSDSPSGKPDSLPFALDRKAREKEFLSTKCFELSVYAESHWKLSLNPTGVHPCMKGFQIFHDYQTRKQRLDRIELVAKSEFGGIVERNMTSPLYVFRRL